MAAPSRLILAVGGIAVVAAAGWFGWQQFFAESGEPPAAAAVTPAPSPKRPPPPKHAASGTEAPTAKAAPATGPGGTPASPDQLVDAVMNGTGLARQLEGLPAQFLAGLRDGFAAQPQPVQALAADIERTFTESFTAARLRQRVRESLRANYDEEYLRAVLDVASTPVAEKLTQMELTKPSQSEQAAYFSGLANNPLSPQRQALLQRLDVASGATDLGTEIALASMRAMALGAAGGNPNAAAQIDRAMEDQRGALTAEMRSGSIMGMAFTYRNATTAELDEYVKLHESEHAKRFSRTVSQAIVAEFKHASGQVGEKIAALVKSKQPASTARAGAPARVTPPALGGGGLAEVSPPIAAPLQGDRSRSKDVRNCLELPTTVEIIQCAEKGL
jgi:hypothetical protein